LRRALERVLFEVQGCGRVVSGSAPTLDAELLAFEEEFGQKRGAPHLARVRVRILLNAERSVLLDDTLEATRVVRAGSEELHFDQVVQAIAAALDEIAERVAEEVGLALR
jgi:hypothetical protein